jgi:hypothetical protein
MPQNPNVQQQEESFLADVTQFMRVVMTDPQFQQVQEQARMAADTMNRTMESLLEDQGVQELSKFFMESIKAIKATAEEAKVDQEELIQLLSRLMKGLKSRMEAVSSDPEIQAQVQLLVEQVKGIMADPSLQRLAMRYARQREARKLETRISRAERRLANLNEMEEQEQQQPYKPLTELLLRANPSNAFHSPMRVTKTRPVARQPTSDAVRSRLADAIKMADEPTEKATIIGSAALGAIFGAQVGDMSDVILYSLIGAYGATLSNNLGENVRKGGDAAVKAYDKAVDVNDKYDILPKGKKTADAVFSVADNINTNYGITEKIDSRLMLSDKFDTLKATVDSKLDDVKSSVDAFTSSTTEVTIPPTRAPTTAEKKSLFR